MPCETKTGIAEIVTMIQVTMMALWNERGAKWILILSLVGRLTATHSTGSWWKCSILDERQLEIDPMTWARGCRRWHGMSRLSYTEPVESREKKVQRKAIFEIKVNLAEERSSVAYKFTPYISEWPWKWTRREQTLEGVKLVQYFQD